jgi:hypothetical protein
MTHEHHPLSKLHTCQGVFGFGGVDAPFIPNVFLAYLKLSKYSKQKFYVYMFTSYVLSKSFQEKPICYVCKDGKI